MHPLLTALLLLSVSLVVGPSWLLRPVAQSVTAPIRSITIIVTITITITFIDHALASCYAPPHASGIRTASFYSLYFRISENVSQSRSDIHLDITTSR